jgi:hypothetical protein
MTIKCLKILFQNTLHYPMDKFAMDGKFVEKNIKKYDNK